VANSGTGNLNSEQSEVLNRFVREFANPIEGRLLEQTRGVSKPVVSTAIPVHEEQYEEIEDFALPEECLSLEEREKELIIKALEKHRGKRKYAARELGISERTLYRKIKEFALD
jgi:transcriptional regulator with PAS, ATPase and Fis domain